MLTNYPPAFARGCFPASATRRCVTQMNVHVERECKTPGGILTLSTDPPKSSRLWATAADMWQSCGEQKHILTKTNKQQQQHQKRPVHRKYQTPNLITYVRKYLIPEEASGIKYFRLRILIFAWWQLWEDWNFFFFFNDWSPRGLTFSWWGHYGLCPRHKPTELAPSFF